MGEITGATSVPRVFVGGAFIGEFSSSASLGQVVLEDDVSGVRARYLTYRSNLASCVMKVSARGASLATNAVIPSNASKHHSSVNNTTQEVVTTRLPRPPAES